MQLAKLHMKTVAAGCGEYSQAAEMCHMYAQGMLTDVKQHVEGISPELVTEHHSHELASHRIELVQWPEGACRVPPILCKLRKFLDLRCLGLTVTEP